MRKLEAMMLGFGGKIVRAGWQIKWRRLDRWIGGISNSCKLLLLLHGRWSVQLNPAEDSCRLQWRWIVLSTKEPDVCPIIAILCQSAVEVINSQICFSMSFDSNLLGDSRWKNSHANYLQHSEIFKKCFVTGSGKKLKLLLICIFPLLKDAILAFASYQWNQLELLQMTHCVS